MQLSSEFWNSAAHKYCGAPPGARGAPLHHVRLHEASVGTSHRASAHPAGTRHARGAHRGSGEIHGLGGWGHQQGLGVERGMALEPTQHRNGRRQRLHLIIIIIVVVVVIITIITAIIIIIIIIIISQSSQSPPPSYHISSLPFRPLLPVLRLLPFPRPLSIAILQVRNHG